MTSCAYLEASCGRGACSRSFFPSSTAKYTRGGRTGGISLPRGFTWHRASPLVARCNRRWEDSLSLLPLLLLQIQLFAEILDRFLDFFNSIVCFLFGGGGGSNKRKGKSRECPFVVILRCITYLLILFGGNWGH